MKFPDWLKEFKEFALRGNMIDLAVGIILGASFSRVVNSLVTDIIMPPLGLLIGGVDFSALSIKLNLPVVGGAPVEIKYGLFINQCIDLIVVSGAIFFLIKLMNRLYRNEEEVTTKDCPECLMSIPLKATKCGHCTTELNG
jgi:large conductance mechanosensitive channel